MGWIAGLKTGIPLIKIMDIFIDSLSKLLLKITCMHHEKQVIANRSIKNTTGTPTPSYPTFFTIIPEGTSKRNMVSMFEEIKTYQIFTRTK